MSFFPMALSYKKNLWSSNPEENRFLFFSFHVDFNFYEMDDNLQNSETEKLIYTVNTTCYGGSASATFRIASSTLSDITNRKNIKVEAIRRERILVDVRNIPQRQTDAPKKLLESKIITIQPSTDIMQKERTISGRLKSNQLLWRQGEVITVSGDEIIIPRGNTLDIEEGCLILLSKNQRIIVEEDATLQVKASFKYPVVFTTKTQSWGQIYFAPHSKGDISHLWLVRGGDDESKKFGHSDSQPVLMADKDSMISIQGGGMIDGFGKGFGAIEARINAVNIIIARMDTGGELKNTVLELLDSHVYELPNGKGKIADDDNDGMYFKSPHPSGDWSRVIRCFFALGEDDGIDHNGAMLEIRDSYFVGFYHEGIATSGKSGGQVFLQDVISQRCQQGLEIGYGHPIVDANRILLIENEIGYRYGDEYPKNWKHNGSGSVKYSISTKSSKANYLEKFQAMPSEGVSERMLSYCFMNNPSQTEKVVLERLEAGGCIIKGMPLCAEDKTSILGPIFCEHRYESQRETGPVSLISDIPSLNVFSSANEAIIAMESNPLENGQNVKPSTLYTSGCGISMSAHLRSSPSSDSRAVKVFLKSTLTDLSDCDGETYLREIKTSHLDLILEQKLVPPTRGRILTYEDLKTLFANEVTEKTQTIMKHTQCVRKGATNNEKPEEINLPASIQLWIEGIKKSKLPKSSISNPSTQFLDYSLFSYIAACMRSFHNTFKLKDDYIFVDNDRCFSPESVFYTKSETHQRRITYHREIVFTNCGFSSDMVNKLRPEPNTGTHLVDRLRDSLSHDRLAGELLQAEPETFQEMEQRIDRFLKYYDEKCKFQN
eukprot:gb/GECH01000881.1/.p1 GENE.gb/GECH01000881.1/~~gb/GECH01000881.1/.p1  ORF type:complete len:831 (+),score=107.20 gb/GECH01000881.1/:1-2493(+)